MTGRRRIIGALAAVGLVLAGPGGAGASTAPEYEGYRSLPLTLDVQSVAVADVVGADGIPDLLATTAGRVYVNTAEALKLVVLPGQGGGQYGAPIYLQTGEEDYNSRLPIAVGDLTEDDKPDVAVGTTFGVSIFEQVEGKLVGPVMIPTGAKVVTLAIADIETKGVKDLIVGTTQQVMLFKGVGAVGAFVPGAYTVPPTPVSASPLDELVVADVAGDFYLDVVGIANGALRVFESHHEMVVRPNRITFEEHEPRPLVRGPNAFDARDLDAGDVDGDGWTDVVVALGDSSSGALNLLRRVAPAEGEEAVLTDPRFEPLPGRAPDSVLAADVDGDDVPEILSVRPGGLAISLVRPDGTVIGPCMQSVPDAIYSPADVAVGDLDGDDRDDVVVGADSADGVVVLRQREPSAQATSAVTLTSATAKAVPNQLVPLRGVLDLSGACPMARQDVKIYRVDGETETYVGTARTDEAGGFTFEVAEPTPGTYRYRAFWAGSDRRPDARSGLVQLNVAKAITKVAGYLRGHDDVEDGVRLYTSKRATYSVRVFPRTAAESVVVAVDVRSEGAWKRVRTIRAPLGSDGRTVLKLGGKQGKTYRVQARVLEDDDALAAASKVLRFRFES